MRAYYAENRSRLIEQKKQYYSDNRDKWSEYHVKYYAKNADKIKARSSKWRADNPERASRQVQDWLIRNRQSQREYGHKRRAKQRANGVYLITKNELNKLYNSTCLYCGSNQSITLDHIIPIARGGTHSIGNLAPACKKCNSSKSDKTIQEWKRGATRR